MIGTETKIGALDAISLISKGVATISNFSADVNNYLCAAVNFCKNAIFTPWKDPSGGGRAWV